MKVKTSILALLVLVLTPVLAHDHDQEAEMPTTGWAGSFARDLERIGDKLPGVAAPWSRPAAGEGGDGAGEDGEGEGDG